MAEGITVGDVEEALVQLLTRIQTDALAIGKYALQMTAENALAAKEIEMLKRELEGKL